MKYPLFILFIALHSVIFAQSKIENIKKAISIHKEAIEYSNVGNDSIAYILCDNAIQCIKNEDLNNEELTVYAEIIHDRGMFALTGLDSISLFYHDLKEAIKIKHNIFGDSENYYWSIQCLADGMIIYGKKVGFPSNIKYYEEAIRHYQLIPGYEKIEGYTIVLKNIAKSYSDIDLKKSIDYTLENLKIKRELNSADTLLLLSDLSDYYKEYGNFDEALKYATIVHKTKESLYEQKSWQIRDSYNDLASIYGRIGDIEKAYNYSEKAREIESIVNGKNTKNYGTFTMNSGLYLFRIKYNDPDKSEVIKLLNEAYNNPFVNKHTICTNLAGLYIKINEPDSVYKYIKEAWEVFKPTVINNLNNMTVENRYKYLLNQQVNIAGLSLPLLYYIQQTNNQKLSILAYDCILFNKNIINHCGDKKISLFDSNANINNVKDNLDENEVAIEIWDVNKGGWIERYENVDLFALIIKKNWEYPKYVNLSKNKIQRTLRGEIFPDSTSLPLYDNIWKDIEKEAELKIGDNIYISTDGYELTNSPIEIVCDYSWKYMNEKYNIVRVTSTSNIEIVKRIKEYSDIALYGGLEYNSDSTIIIKECTQYSHSRNMSNIFDDISDYDSSCLRTKAEYLPWSKVEVDSISHIFEKEENNNIYMFTGNKGIEESFKSLSGNSPSIIHLATHGFCRLNPEKEMDWNDYYVFCMENTGLLFSGVLSLESTIKKEQIDDGFLTATEISQLDLSNTKLVVLSACNSGVGGNSPYGIVGLQKAFKAAGVESIIMTLWEVDDAATSIFMTTFYKELLITNNRHDSFLKAQRHVKKIFDNVHYWGPFVMLD